MAGIGVKEGLAEKALESVKTGWIQNMALFFYSQLTHTITLNWVKFHLTRKATKKMPVSSATTIHGFPLPKLFWDTAAAPLKFIKKSVRHIFRISATCTGRKLTFIRR